MKTDFSNAPGHFIF